MSTRFPFVSDRLALNFCNTAGAGFELLQGPEDLNAWLLEAGHATPEDLPCAEEFDETRALRDALRPALLTGDTARIAQLVGEWLDPTMVRLCVDRDTLGTHPEPVGRSCRCVLVPIVLDALEIARDHPDRVRECASHACPGLFLDLSRNRSRRWCSMEVCGSREKARAYYRRHNGDCSG